MAASGSKVRAVWRGEGGGGARRARKRWIARIKALRGGTGVALAEVGRGETADEAIDAEATHGLVAETEAGVDIASHDEAPAGDHLALHLRQVPPLPGRVCLSPAWRCELDRTWILHSRARHCNPSSSPPPSLMIAFVYLPCLCASAKHMRMG